MKRALIAVGGPLQASRLAVATAFLTGAGAEADLVRVTGAASLKRERATRAALTEAIAQLRAHGLSATGHVCNATQGSIAEELARQARERRSDLIVLGSGHFGRPPRPARASISQGVLSQTPIAALIVPNFALVPVAGLGRVIAAVGADEDCGPIAAQLLRLRRRPEVMVLHARRLVAAPVGSPPPADPTAVSEAALAGMLDRLAAHGLRCRSQEVDGSADVAWTIANIVDVWGAQLAVVG